MSLMFISIIAALQVLITPSDKDQISANAFMKANPEKLGSVAEWVPVRYTNVIN